MKPPPNEVDEDRDELDDLRREDDLVVQACEKHDCDTARLYQCFHESGFELGPAFQTLYDAQYSPDVPLLARAKVKVFPWPAKQCPHHMSSIPPLSMVFSK
jgi:hypothetical protein